MSGARPYARIFNALRAANVPEAQATDAADALLSIKDDKITAVRTDLKDLRRDVNDVKSDLRALKVQVDIQKGAGRHSERLDAGDLREAFFSRPVPIGDEHAAIGDQHSLS